MSGASVLWGAVRRMAIAGAALFVLCIAGLIWFATVPSAGDRAGPTDAIVVLTGGSQRLNSGIALLRDGKGLQALCLGRQPSRPPRGASAQLRVTVWRRPTSGLPAASSSATRLKTRSAMRSETAQWMREQGFHSLRLVTAWYHMRRSLLEFDRAMPGIEIIPYPVFPDELTQEHWWMSPGAMLLLAGEYGKYLGALLRPFVERLRSTPALRSTEAEIGR